MIYDYDFANKLIDIPMGITSVNILDLISDIRSAEATEQGILYGQIAGASGKESLGGSVAVGVTVQLLDEWQIRFAAGEYAALISGGNLVGGLAENPVAYSSGVQILNIQSAASTIVVTSDGLNTAQAALLSLAASQSTVAATEATKGRKMQTNKAIISGDELSVSIYDDNGTTLLHQFDVSADKKTRVPV